MPKFWHSGRLDSLPARSGPGRRPRRRRRPRRLSTAPVAGGGVGGLTRHNPLAYSGGALPSLWMAASRAARDFSISRLIISLLPGLAVSSRAGVGGDIFVDRSSTV